MKKHHVEHMIDTLSDDIWAVRCHDGLVQTPAYARPFYFVAGLGLVGLGYLGLILPVMPGTIFFILALGAFRRSNQQLENWLLNSKVVGPMLRDWDATGAIRPRTKKLIYWMLWLSIIGSCASTWRHFGPGAVTVGIWIGLTLVAAGVTRYIATRPSG